MSEYEILDSVSPLSNIWNSESDRYSHNNFYWGHANGLLSDKFQVQK